MADDNLSFYGYVEKRADVYKFCMSYDVTEECEALLDRSLSRQ